MAMTDLKTFKQYVHATEFDDDDEVMQVILDSAESYVVRATGRTIDELEEMGGGALPSQLTLATLMVAAARYAQPEGETSQQAHEVPFGVTTMIKQYRKLANPPQSQKEEGGV